MKHRTHCPLGVHPSIIQCTCTSCQNPTGVLLYLLTLPVQTPVTFSRSPLIHVFPDPGKLASATGSRPRPSRNRHEPFFTVPNFCICLSHLSVHLENCWSSVGERRVRQKTSVAGQGLLSLPAIKVLWYGASDGTGNVRCPYFSLGIE